MKPWTIKYNPKNLKEVAGNENSLYKLKECVLKNKSVLVHGPVGVGKTCSVYALANDLGFEVFEVNASMIRNKNEINEKVGSAVNQASLFYKGRIILVDELDGISGKEDRGGVQALGALLKDSNFPIILVANDPWSANLYSLRSKCEVIEFKRLDYLSVYKFLKNICAKEKIKFSEEDLKSLARMAGGDLRAAIIDLQSLVENSKELKKEDLEFLGSRIQKESIFNSLKLIFKSKNTENVLGAFDDTDMELDECFLWLDENIPKEYKNSEDLRKAYDVLSKADVWKSRIRRQQHYRFLVYRAALMTAGIALAKKEKYSGFNFYKKPDRIFKLWKAKQKFDKRKKIAEKLKEELHCSQKKIIKEQIPYLKIIYKNKGNLNLGLDNEEVEWLRN